MSDEIRLDGIETPDVALALVLASLEGKRPLAVPLAREVVALQDCAVLVQLVGNLVGLASALALIICNDDTEFAADMLRKMLLNEPDQEDDDG